MGVGVGCMLVESDNVRRLESQRMRVQKFRLLKSQNIGILEPKRSRLFK